MVDTPERIWMSAPDIDNEHDVWFDPSEGGTEYLRADLAALRAAVPDESVLRQALQLCVDMIVANGLETALSNTLETAREALAASPAVPEGEPVAVKPLPMDCAPKDSTMCRLLVDYGEDDFGALEDSAEPTWTIGFNQFDHTGDDEWLMAGWDWSHDVFTQGQGKVIGWLPFHSAPRPDMERELAEARAERDVAQFGYEHQRSLKEHAQAERDAIAADKARLEMDLLRTNKALSVATLSGASIPAPADRPRLEGVEKPLTRMDSSALPLWHQIEELFAQFCLPSPPVHLRDELVTILSWARYGEALDAALSGASIPAPDKAGSKMEPVSIDYLRGQIGEILVLELDAKEGGRAVSQAVVRILALVAASSSPDKAEARREALDAARYRWLREQHWNEDVMSVVCNPKKSVRLGSYCPSGQLLDEAIDAAIAAIRAISNPARREGE